MKPEDFEDNLVILAETIVRATRENLKQKADTGRTQVSNAISVANATESLLVFRNWLRYQKAREEFWRVSDPQREADIAKRLEAALQEIAEIKKQAGAAETMRAVVRFLGYFRRALVAMDHFDQIPAAERR
jgi:6-phosphofructokinase